MYHLYITSGAAHLLLLHASEDGGRTSRVENNISIVLQVVVVVGVAVCLFSRSVQCVDVGVDYAAAESYPAVPPSYNVRSHKACFSKYLMICHGWKICLLYRDLVFSIENTSFISTSRNRQKILKE